MRANSGDTLRSEVQARPFGDRLRLGEVPFARAEPTEPRLAIQFRLAIQTRQAAEPALAKIGVAIVTVAVGHLRREPGSGGRDLVIGRRRRTRLAPAATSTRTTRVTRNATTVGKAWVTWLEGRPARSLRQPPGLAGAPGALVAADLLAQPHQRRPRVPAGR